MKKESGVRSDVRSDSRIIGLPKSESQESGVRSDVRSDSRTIGLPKSESQDPETLRDLTGGSDIEPAASAASCGVREPLDKLRAVSGVEPLAPALECGSSASALNGRSSASAPDAPERAGKEQSGGRAAALQSATGAGVAPGALAGGKTSRREICTDVAKLAPEWREQAEQLIVEGSTFDDVVEIFKERKGPRLTLHAVEVFYQSNLDLQKRRVRHLIEQVQKLKHAMTHPESTEAQLADATLFTGLLQLSRRFPKLTVKDAQSLRMQRENLQLRKRILKMREYEARRKKSEAYQRYKFEEERRRKLTLENQKLEEILKKLRQDQTLPADVMGKIQEIYGIVKEPYIPPRLAEQLAQNDESA